MDERNYAESTEKIVAAILSSIRPGDRSAVANRAVDLAYNYQTLARNTLPQIFPSEGSVGAANALINGTVAVLSALSDANGDTTVRSIWSKAKQSFGEGTAYNGAPDEIGQSLPIAVAAALDPANLIPDADDLTVKAVKAIGDKYDCINHHIPLGGCAVGPAYWDQVALAGKGKLKNFLKNTINKIAEGAEQATDEVKNQVEGGIADKNAKEANSILSTCIPLYATYMTSSNQEEAVAALSDLQSHAFEYSKFSGGRDLMDDLAKMVPTGSSFHTTTNRATGLWGGGSSLDVIAENAKSEIETAMQKMSDLVEQQSSLKEASQSLSLNLARLAWAKAALGASDEVALLMTMVHPDMSSVSSMISNSVNVMSAARKTGSVSNMSALISALKMGFSKGGIDTSTFDALFGDPAESQLQEDLMLPAPNV